MLAEQAVSPATTRAAAPTVASPSGAEQGATDTGDAVPQDWHFFTSSMCPPSKVTFLRSEGPRIFYQVESGHVSCTVYVNNDMSSEKKQRYLDLLGKGVNNPGSICVKYESMMSDPDCKEPRDVDEVTAL